MRCRWRACARGLHNTQLQQGEEVAVHYRFHPFHGKVVTVRRRCKDGNGGDDGVLLVPPTGPAKVVPIWMLDPQAAMLDLCEQPRISKQALGELRIFINVSLDALDAVAPGGNGQIGGAAVTVHEDDQKSCASATRCGIDSESAAPASRSAPKRAAAPQAGRSGPKRRPAPQVGRSAPKRRKAPAGGNGPQRGTA